MSTYIVDRERLPSVDSPLDALDTLLTGGGVVGILLYVVGLLVGNVETATFGVVVGVACVLGTLTVRSARDVVRTLV